MHDAALRMDRMYAWQTTIYDATRKPYLLGRDRLIDGLAPPSNGRVLEIGCGTGRNLVAAGRRWPKRRLYGLDVSGVMLRKARRQTQRAAVDVAFAQGDATHFDALQAFGVPRFERVFFSYALSMIPEWEQALDHAASLLAPAGKLSIVDFGDGRELPAPARGALRRWLHLFDVQPRDDMARVLASVAERHRLRVESTGVWRSYAMLATLHRA